MKKKGFKITPRVAVLTFEEPFDGLEIRCRHDMPAEDYFRFADDIEKVKESEGTAATYRAAMEMFIANIALDWNAEDEKGEPIPLTVDTMLRTVPAALGLSILPRWREAMTGVAVPLEPPSTNGNSSGAP